MPTEAMTTQTYLYEEYHTQPTFNTDTDSQNKHTINNRYCSITIIIEIIKYADKMEINNLFLQLQR